LSDWDACIWKANEPMSQLSTILYGGPSNKEKSQSCSGSYCCFLLLTPPAATSRDNQIFSASCGLPFHPSLRSFHRMFSITAHSKRGCKMQTRKISTSRIPFSHSCSSHRFEKNIRCINKRYKNTKKMPCYKYLYLIKVYFPRAPLPLLTITLIPLTTLRK